MGWIDGCGAPRPRDPPPTTPAVAAMKLIARSVRASNVGTAAKAMQRQLFRCVNLRRSCPQRAAGRDGRQFCGTGRSCHNRPSLTYPLLATKRPLARRSGLISLSFRENPNSGQIASRTKILWAGQHHTAVPGIGVARSEVLPR